VHVEGRKKDADDVRGVRVFGDERATPASGGEVRRGSRKKKAMKPASASRTKATGQYPNASGMIASSSGISM
jgi:hypothetical protein